MIALGMHFDLNVTSSIKKQEIKTKVANKLIKEIFFETCDFQEIFKLELEPYKMSEMQHQVELAKIRIEREKLEREYRERERKFELEKLNLVRQERKEERELNFELKKLKLPLSEQTFTGRTVLIQGVEFGVNDVPLHRICSKSDLITGPVTVGVRPTLSVPGVPLLLGNDLASGKVVPDPIGRERITSNVTSDDEDDDFISSLSCY